MRQTVRCTCILCVLALFLLAGCGQPTASTSTGVEVPAEHAEHGTEQTAAAQFDARPLEPVSLKVGYATSLGSQLGFIAQQEGFFEEENLQVEFVPFQSTADGLNALQAGKIDIGISFGTAGPLTFISNGANFVIFGGHLEGGSPIFARPEDADKYKDIRDFIGKKIGTIRLYTGDIVFRAALADAGLDWEKDVEIIEFKNPSILVEAIKSGKVDVGVGAPSNLGMAAEAGLVAVTWSNHLAPGHVCCRVVAQGPELEKKQDAYKRFIKALIKAERVKEQQPEVTVQASLPYLKLDEETVRNIVLEPHQNNYSDPNKKAVEKMWNAMRQIGYIPKDTPVQLENHINIELYRQAIAELLEEQPDDPFFQKVKERFEQQNL